MKLLLVGCGGYAAGYVRELFSPLNDAGHTIEGIVDPYADRSPVIDLIREKGIPVYDTLEAFYEKHTAPVAIICTPIGLHLEQALTCFRHGSHVLMEKPLAATSELCRKIIDAAKTFGKKLGVGYQLCYDPIMLDLKKRIEGRGSETPESLLTRYGAACDEIREYAPMFDYVIVNKDIATCAKQVDDIVRGKIPALEDARTLIETITGGK